MYPNVMTSKEAAKRLDISEQRMRTLLQTGIVEGTLIGKQWLVNADSVTVFLQNPANHPNPADQPFAGKHSGPLVALSFFSGAMGLDLGLEQVGIHCRLACEIDPACRKTIHANRPHMGLIGDVWNYTAEQIRLHAGLTATEPIDLMVGGPPCQAFSTAGGRRGLSDQRGNALVRYLQLIE
jgi:DNA (cytosine-5)-methyltransferase 1